MPHFIMFFTFVVCSIVKARTRFDSNFTSLSVLIRCGMLMMMSEKCGKLNVNDINQSLIRLRFFSFITFRILEVYILWVDITIIYTTCILKYFFQIKVFIIFRKHLISKNKSAADRITNISYIYPISCRFIIILLLLLFYYYYTALYII